MSEILRSYTVRALAFDLLTDVATAAGAMATGNGEPAVVWGLVGWSALKKLAIAGARLVLGDSPATTHPGSS